MANVLILGAGMMGSAFSFPLADAGHAVRLVGTHLDREWIVAVRETGIHPKLKIKLPEGVTPFTHDELAEALTGAIDLIVLGVNSAGVDWAVEQLGPLLKTPPPILMLTKGLRAVQDRLRILPDIVREGLARHGVSTTKVGAVGGPCIAGELAARRDSSVVIASADAAFLDRVLPLLAAPYYHARPSTDVVGVEACAAFKNLYTLAVGFPAGLLAKQGRAPNDAFMHNLAASLFAQSLREMEHFVHFMGGASANVRGLPGAGDLYVTCQGGRNTRLAYLLGSGLRYREAKARYLADQTLEGAELALAIGPTLDHLFQQGTLNPVVFPLAAAILDAICRDLPMQVPWTAFHRE
jgi:glycerol-3-phosphate dehydrogenase (NAD(P)+)